MRRAVQAAGAELAAERTLRKEAEGRTADLTARLAAADVAQATAVASAAEINTALAAERSKTAELEEEVRTLKLAMEAERGEALRRYVAHLIDGVMLLPTRTATGCCTD